MPGADPRKLDFRFPSECPACGRKAAWDGPVEQRSGLIMLSMSCTYCDHGFWESTGEWTPLFRSDDPPEFTPGCEIPPELVR